ncbi:plasma membrane localization protein [Saxophila tyrrhenica]|uniref:Plasma membrane localization protein n=1 Tax=Saxophila tyrrhenica TaxID=1690608 RepID=A0AAV9P3T6_9PEZI|nr:plasma membrane localization protein [Saxophila tyrrhenica]
MPKGTHLPGHLDSFRQTLRPKHQLLVLKCYPRLPKNSAADVKPNGSELSYLLYYASTRRSKLHKVGSFLERKTASDVYKAQSARVLVTLQILTTLLENKAVGGGSGFALIAPYVLRIIREILQSTNDISLIEASLTTWAVFCRDQDQATLNADHEYRELYEEVVKRYASLARKDGAKKLGRSAQAVAVQDAIRLREAGLSAMKSILLSDALSENGKLLDLVVPTILTNVHGEDEAYLTNLQRQSQQNEADEKDRAVARRMSMATVRTYTNATADSFDADPRQAEGTVQDADALAEEEAAVLALDCLRAVFATENRQQIRAAASAVLRYLSGIPSPKIPSKPSEKDFVSNSWATKLFEICTAWTPVQERFILIVTAVETLVRLPLKESDLQQHLLYTDIVGNILRSDLNLIGLSVMDVLLSLIQQILRVLQLNGPRVSGRSSAAQLFSSDEEIKHPASPTSVQPENDLPSEARIRLTERLKHCISDLATHVYYTDQVSDMLAALLMRLKPTPASAGHQNATVTAAAIEEPKAAVAEVASNVSLPARERSNSAASAYFTFDTARQIALEAARDMLLVANSAQSIATGGVADSRNKVSFPVWEGTQWLLRDPTFAVRKAYIEALTTWLQLEMKPSDARVKEPKDKTKVKADGSVARRAVSSASHKKKQSKKATNTFLQLLHLSIYEHALSSATSQVDGDREFLFLHHLLVTLVQKLGVNSVASGLPMILALQDEMGNTENIGAKARIGSLVHGYLWTLSEVFEFDASFVGQEIFSEVRRRRDAGIWLKDLSVPPKPLEQAALVSTSKSSRGQTADLQPFESRQALVDRIADSYSSAFASPPTSAPGSPGRSPGRNSSIAVASLDRTASNYLSAKQPPDPSAALPDKVKEAMLEKWTRESCLAAIAAAAPKSVSVSASRSSPSHALAAGNHRQLLAAVNGPSPVRNNSVPKNLSSAGNGTPPSQKQQNLGARLHSQSPHRQRSGSVDDTGAPNSSAGHRGTVRVDDLKRVLAGGAFSTGLLGAFPGQGAEDTASESLVDVEGEDLASENGAGFETPPQSQFEAAAAFGRPPAIIEEAPTPMNTTNDLSSEAPPVLSLSQGAVTNGKLPYGSSQPGAAHVNVTNGPVPTKPPPSRGGASVKSNRGGHSRKDLTALLAGIGTGDGAEKEKGAFTGLEAPPY